MICLAMKPLLIFYILLSPQSVCVESRQLFGPSGVDPTGHDPPHPGLLSVQPPQPEYGD